MKTWELLLESANAHNAELRGQLAAMRKGLRAAGTILDHHREARECDSKGCPENRARLRDALADGAGEPEAEVIAAAEKQAALRREWTSSPYTRSLEMGVRYDTACENTDKAVKRMEKVE